MRFVSRWGRFGVQIRPLVLEAYATGMTRTTQEPVYCMFHEGKLLPHERELAMEHWTWNGFYQEQDEVTQVAPDYRIGVYDSVEDQVAHGWPDETRLEVERALIDHADRYTDILVVPSQFATPPWPRYDEYTGSPSALARKLVDEGHDLELTIGYEREHQNRPKVVEALEAALVGEPEREEEVVG